MVRLTGLLKITTVQGVGGRTEAKFQRNQVHPTISFMHFFFFYSGQSVGLGMNAPVPRDSRSKIVFEQVREGPDRAHFRGTNPAKLG